MIHEKLKYFQPILRIIYGKNSNWVPVEVLFDAWKSKMDIFDPNLPFWD